MKCQERLPFEISPGVPSVHMCEEQGLVHDGEHRCHCGKTWTSRTSEPVDEEGT